MSNKFGGVNLYGFIMNKGYNGVDVLGQSFLGWIQGDEGWIPGDQSHMIGALDQGVGDTWQKIERDQGASGGFMSHIKNLASNFSGAIDKSSPSIFVGQIGPVSAFLKGGIKGTVGRCCRENGSKGWMFAGSVFMVIDAGVGTPPADAVRRGKFKSGPRKGQPYFKNLQNGRFASGKWSRGQGVGHSTAKLPDCETKIDVSGALKAYIGASYLVGSTAINGNIGSCSLSGGCKWDMNVDMSSTFGATKPGLRAGLEFTAQGVGTIQLN